MTKENKCNKNKTKQNKKTKYYITKNLNETILKTMSE